MTTSETNIQKLKTKLDSMSGTIKGITLGDKPCTAEELAGSILQAIEAVESGDFEDATDWDDEYPINSLEGNV